jgi:1,4-dihydroxy-2-naphthoyl-CoA synthase
LQTGERDSTPGRIGAMLAKPSGGSAMAYEAVDYQTITVELREHVAILTLNRPDRLNAINRDVMAEVPAAVATLKADDEVRALVVTGASAPAPT